MRVAGRRIAAAALFSLIPMMTSGAGREADPDMRRAIADVDRQFRQAMISHDETALRDILTEDYRWVGNTGQTNDKARLLRDFHHWHWTIYERTDVAIHDLGSAVMMTADTIKNDQHAATVLLFRKEKGRWRLSFLQNTPKPVGCSPDKLFC